MTEKRHLLKSAQGPSSFIEKWYLCLLTRKKGIKFWDREGAKFFVCHSQPAMYCLQWLIPVLLIPKPVNPALLYNHVVFMILYLFSFFIERKPCTICSLVFLFAVILICSSGYGNCLFWNDEDNQCPLSKEDLGMYIFLRKQG